MQHCVLGKRKTYKTKKITEGDKKCDSTLKPMRINFHYIRHAISLHRHCPEHEQQTHLCLPCMQPQLKKKKEFSLSCKLDFQLHGTTYRFRIATARKPYRMQHRDRTLWLQLSSEYKAVPALTFRLVCDIGPVSFSLASKRTIPA